MTIVLVTNKALTVFFSPKKILLDTNPFSMSTSLKWKEPYRGKFAFFQFQY